MGKWIARLANLAARPAAGTDKTDIAPLLSVLAVGSEGGTPNFRPAELRERDVRDRLLRWGWSPEQAEATARRIKERHADDERKTCIECRHYRPREHRCVEHPRAGLVSPNVCRDLAELPQRCPGLAPSGRWGGSESEEINR